MHFTTQPRPVAKNATQKSPAGNRTRILWIFIDQRSTDWATEAVAESMGASSVYVQVVMPVK